MTNTGALTFALPDGGTLVVPAPQPMIYTPAPPPPVPRRTLIGLDAPIAPAAIGTVGRYQRLFAGNKLPVLPVKASRPAGYVPHPSLPVRANARPSDEAMEAWFATWEGEAVFTPDHETNRPGKPAPDEWQSNMRWARDLIKRFAPGWLLGAVFGEYAERHGNGTPIAQYLKGMAGVIDLTMLDIYADLESLRGLPAQDTLMTVYRKFGMDGLAELGVAMRAPRGPAEAQAAAELYAGITDEVRDGHGYAVGYWGTTGDPTQIDPATSKPVDYTPVPYSAQAVIMRDRIRTQ
jgi:hypothetical protein